MQGDQELGRAPWAQPQHFSPTEAVDGEEEKEATGKTGPGRSQERMRAAGRWLQHLCLTL